MPWRQIHPEDEWRAGEKRSRGVSDVISPGSLGKPMLRRGPLNRNRKKGGHAGNLNGEKCSRHGGQEVLWGSPRSSFGFSLGGL